MKKKESQMDPADPRGDDKDFWIAHIGASLRKHRSGRYTVEELAEKAGVSAGLISQIERGIGNPSFVTLHRLVNALEIPLSQMFVESESQRDGKLVRKTDRRRIEIPAQGIIMEMLVPGNDHKLGVMSMTIPVNFDGASTVHIHEGHECVILESGELVATVNGTEYQLREGDALTYDATLPHWWSNRSSYAARMLAISTPPALGKAH